MKILRGELFKNENIIRHRQEEYSDRQSFFKALVIISCELNIDIPIWTHKEDRDFDETGVVYWINRQNRTIKFSKVTDEVPN